MVIKYKTVTVDVDVEIDTDDLLTSPQKIAMCFKEFTKLNRADRDDVFRELRGEEKKKVTYDLEDFIREIEIEIDRIKQGRHFKYKFKGDNNDTD
jgi:hypothetical protein